MSWNYRIVKNKDGYYGLAEIYYHEPDHTIEGYTSNTMSPGGETLEELRGDFDLMKKAFEKPVLVEGENETLTTDEDS